MPNDAKFNLNQFNEKKFKPFIPQNKESKPSKNSLKSQNRRLSLIDSQFLTCLDQFNNLIERQSNKLNVDLNISFDLDNYKLNNNSKTLNKSDQLAQPKTIEDLSFYLSNLIRTTQIDLIKCSQIDLKSQNEHLKNCHSENNNHTIHYLNGLSKEKLLIYKDQLNQTIKKLNDDLVDELEHRDLIYLKRDKLFDQIEKLSKRW